MSNNKMSSNTDNKSATIRDIKMNGIKTIIQEIIPKPLSHKWFNNIVNKKETNNFIIAVLYNPRKLSIVICVMENTIYMSAGAHNCPNTIIYNI